MPEALVDRAVALADERGAGGHPRVAAERVRVERERGERRALVRRELGHVVVQARHRDRAARVDEPREQRGQRGRGVGHRPAPHAAVDRVIERAHGDVDLHDPAQAGRERRDAGIEVRGVGEHEHVAVEPRAVRAQELREVPGADLLLALDDPLHVHGQRARRPRARRAAPRGGAARPPCRRRRRARTGVRRRAGSARTAATASGSRARAAARRDARRRARVGASGPACSHSPTAYGCAPGSVRTSTRSRPLFASSSAVACALRATCAGSKPGADTEGIRASAARSSSAASIPRSSDSITFAGALTRQRSTV